MRVYFDHAATTPLDRDILAAMTPYMTDSFGNSSSLHSFGREALSALDESRSVAAHILNAHPSEIYFTSGGTESDNWAILGVARASGKRRVVTTTIEHPAVLESCKRLEQEGFSVTYLPVDSGGKVSVEEVEKALGEDVALVSVMFANNEVGSIQPIEEIGALCREKGIPFHVDAVQAFGTISIDVQAQKIDLLSLSAHKFYGPKGVGLLYLRRGVKCDRYARGGAQERGQRAGTVNVPGVVGMALAMQKARETLRENVDYVRSLRDRFVDRVLSEIPLCEWNGGRDGLVGNANVLFRFVDNKSLLIALDLSGVAVSVGSACSAGDVNPSHVLLACGLTEEEANSSVRFSFGKENTIEEVDYVVEKLKEMVAKMRAVSPLFLRLKKDGDSV